MLTTAIPNGAHILDANGNTANFTVDSELSHPLIIYVGSELDGFTAG